MSPKRTSCFFFGVHRGGDEHQDSALLVDFLMIVPAIAAKN